MGTRIQVGGIPMVVSKRLPPWEISPEGTSGSVEFNVFKASRNQKLKTDIELVNLEGDSFTDLSDVPSGLYELELFHKGYFKNNMIVNVVGGKNTKYNTSLLRQNLEPSDIAVTLNWNAQLKDLDLHVVFRSNVTETCQVYFNHKQCGGAKLINFAINGGNTGTESIKLEAGPSHYLFYARAVGGADDPFPLMLSDAHLNLYSFAKESQILSIDMPVATPVADTWIAFCYSGLKGPAGIVPLRMARKGGAEEEMLKICESLYGELEFPGIDVEVEGNEIIYDFKGP